MLNKKSEFSLMLMKHWTYVLRCKNYGVLWNQYLLEEILPDRCLYKRNNSRVLIKIG